MESSGRTDTTTIPSASSLSSTSALALNATQEVSSLMTEPTVGSIEATVEMQSLNWLYVASEALVAFLAILGNALVVYVFCTNRSLRRYRNYYIVGLAVADFLVGLVGIPMAILSSVGLPRNLYGCLFTLSVLMVLCTVSILCLVAVSIDRYWATTNPFAYYRNMTTTTAVGIILCCWFGGTIIGLFPLFGWYNWDGWLESPPEYCYFTKVSSYSYLVFLYFATIIFPALLMAGFYGYIYHVVLIKIRQKGTLAPQGRRPSEPFNSRSGSLNSDNRGATQMMRIMQSEKRREGKAAKKLGIIVLFFMICWMPLYTINCIQAFDPNFHVPLPILNFTIILSHANSALNPFLYAYHLKEFRLAMKNALCSLFGWLCCGHVNTENQKDNWGVSRSQTMPSIGNASVSTQTGKFSIKFRKVPTAHSSSSDAAHRISPRGGGKSMVNTPSRDNLFLPLPSENISNRAIASLSLINDPITSRPAHRHHHSQDNRNSRYLSEDSIMSSNSNVNNPKGATTTRLNYETNGNCKENFTCREMTILEAEVEPHQPNCQSPSNSFKNDDNIEPPSTSSVVAKHTILKWNTSPTMSVKL